MLRWWSDSAPEFAAAAKVGRAQRPLAHYQSAPYRPQANGIAERSSRSTLCTHAGGLPETWWPLAARHWVMSYNASWKDKNGRSPWDKLFDAPASFAVYPFGAMVGVYLSPWDPRSERTK